jgi:hypothetical protein
MGIYGSVEWVVTFTSNPHMVPTGAGDVNDLQVRQANDPKGALAQAPTVTETLKGSDPLSGNFSVYFFDPDQVSPDVDFEPSATDAFKARAFFLET